MKQFSRLVLAVLVGVWCLSATAQAAIIIDSFDAAGSITDNNGTDTNGNSNIAVGANIFGGDRDTFGIITSAPAGNRVLKAEADGLTGTLYIDRSARVNGAVILQWDGLSPPDTGPPAAIAPNFPTALDPTRNLSFSLAPQDLTAGNTETGIMIRIVFADVAGQSLELSLWGASSSVASTTLVPIAVPVVNGPPVDLFIPFASLVTRPGASSAVDPHAVSAITLVATSLNSAADLEIDLIATYAPEPTAGALLLLGIVPLWSRYRHRQN